MWNRKNDAVTERSGAEKVENRYVANLKLCCVSQRLFKSKLCFILEENFNFAHSLTINAGNGIIFRSRCHFHYKVVVVLLLVVDDCHSHNDIKAKLQ